MGDDNMIIEIVICAAIVTSVGKMPLTPQERRAANSIAGGNAFRMANLRTLRLFKENIGEDFDDVDEAVRFVTRSMKNMREEIEILRHNNEGRRRTITMLKGMAVEQRFQWERINHECPVELHSDVDINRVGRVINPLTGRFL
jgi:hypothetical protein